MSRPWYTYLLLTLGVFSLLAALFRPTVGATSTAPGGVAQGAERRLLVGPISPLARAGVRSGDRFVHAETVYVDEGPGPHAAAPRPLRWLRDIPRPGEITVRRGEKTLQFTVAPISPAWPLRLFWLLVALLNLGMVTLALALFWQRPREGPATLLGLVLLSAPVFAFPGEPRVFALLFAAHFFTIFPTSTAAPTSPPRSRWRRIRWDLVFGLYLPVLLFGLIGLGLFEDGKVTDAVGVFDLMALILAAYSLLKILARGRRAASEQRPLFHTLALAAASIMAAVVVGVSERLWFVSDQLVPANLIPAILFSIAVTRLVFRLRVLEVRLIARRTLQYLLARWTLGTLFLIPSFLLVWQSGQQSVSQTPAQGGAVLGYLLWMLVAALLLGKRNSVLRNLDRRFFRDVEAARESLLRLARGLGGSTDEGAVLATLERGAWQALRPLRAATGPPDAPPPFAADLSVPIRRGEKLLGWLHLAPKENAEPYSAEERALLEAAASQAAMEIENLRLSAALLSRQRTELTARSAGVLSGAEEERRRLAADLHDQVLPELRQIAGEAARLKGLANGMAPDLERLEGEVRAAMDSVREVMEALRPSALDMLGLGDALESYLRKAAARRTPPLAVSVRRSGLEPELTPEQSLALYRIVQEGINNVLKHSGASRAGLEIANQDGVLSLALWDDGRGMPPESGLNGGHGLGNIRYRADLIGARVAWDHPEEGGTRLVVALNLSDTPSPRAGTV